MPIIMPRPGGLPVPDVCLSPGASFEIRSARVSDVHGMSALINQYATENVMLARGPQYLYQHIQDYMVVTAPFNGEEVVIACGAVHVLWADLAEIRSVAVHPGCKGLGLGRSIVGALIERCALLGIPRAFVFTLVSRFFGNCGFAEYDRELLPPAVWVECSKCPKFYRCDEICMLRAIDIDKTGVGNAPLS